MAPGASQHYSMRRTAPRCETAGYFNRSILRTFSAMFQHRSQSKWWAHLLTERYTVVNTYKRISAGPVATATGAVPTSGIAVSIPEAAGDDVQPDGGSSADPGSVEAGGILATGSIDAAGGVGSIISGAPMGIGAVAGTTD
jgi:hypothetical protein